MAPQMVEFGGAIWVVLSLILVAGATRWDESARNEVGRVRERSLCNTFGGCGSARSIEPGAGAMSISSRAADHLKARTMSGGAPYSLQFQGSPQLAKSSARATGTQSAPIGGAPPSALRAASAQQERFLYDQLLQQHQAQQRQQQPLDLLLHPARVGKLVEDPARLETIGRGLRTRMSQ